MSTSRFGSATPAADGGGIALAAEKIVVLAPMPIASRERRGEREQRTPTGGASDP